MGLLTFGLNVTLDGCIDHTQGIVDDELHDYWTQLMDQSGAMLFGRNTYELMEGAWPAVARDPTAPRAMREWAQKLEAKPKYVVSGTLTTPTWRNSESIGRYDPEAIRRLKDDIAGDLYVSGSGTLVRAMLADGLVDELHLFVYPLTRGEGPRLFPAYATPGKLSLAATEPYENGVVYLAYRPIR